MTWSLALDLMLLLGLTLRLKRLVFRDSVAEWTLQDPVKAWANIVYEDGKPTTWKHWVWLGVSCIFCLGFWLDLVPLTSFYLWHDELWWRLAAGAFTLNYVSSHMSARLD